MRLLLFFLSLTFFASAQPETFTKKFYDQLPVHYYPFYNGIQLIEVDYFERSLALGRWGDMMHPRGGSDYHDAIQFDIPNGFMLRNEDGEVIRTFGMVESVQLTPPNETITITHKERLNSLKMLGTSWKEANGYGYRFRECMDKKGKKGQGEMNYCIGIIDTLGNVVFEDVSIISYANGEYLVAKSGKCAIYDSTFVRTLDFTDGGISRAAAGKYFFFKDGDTKIINRFGEQLDGDNYVGIEKSRYGDNYIYSSRTIDGIQRGIMRSDLSKLTPPKYKNIYPLQSGFSVSDSSGKWALLNQNGLRITGFEFSNYDSFRDYQDGTYSAYKRDGSFKQGMIDTTGKVIIPIKYDRVDRFKNDLAVVALNGKEGIVNRRGEVQGEIIYSKILNVYSTHVHVSLNGKQGVISHSGEVILEPIYASVSCFDSEFLYVSNDENERYFYNVNSKELIPCPYFQVWCFAEGFCKVSKDGKMGMVDTNMKEVIPVDFDYVSPMQAGTVVVKKGDLYGLYNSKFELIKALKYRQFRTKDSGGFEVY